MDHVQENIENQLKMVKELQERLSKELSHVSNTMESLQHFMPKVEPSGLHQGLTINDIVPKMDGMKRLQSEMFLKIEDVGKEIRVMDPERLWMRKLTWRDMPDSREKVVPFLSVQDILNLDTAMSTNRDDRLREMLKRSYNSAVIPAFDAYRFTDKDNFKSLRWVMKAGIELQRCKLELSSLGVKKNPDEVLRSLVDREHGDIAAVYVMKSGAKDMVKGSVYNVNGAPNSLSRNTGWREDISTLWLAAEKGFVPVVRALLSRGADIEKPSKNGATPLFRASQEGRVEVVRVLLEHGADIHKTAKNGATPLHAASEQGHADVVRELMKRGAMINMVTKLRSTPLHNASQNGNTEVLRVLLSHGGEVDKVVHKRTPLFVAAQEGHADAVKVLLEHGAEINKIAIHGATPLNMASLRGHVEVVKMLLENGADIHKAAFGEVTPLYIASENGHKKVVEVLLKHGADINRAQSQGATALSIASQKGHKDIVEMLLEQNAEINKASNGGATPLYAASDRGHAEVVRVLLEHGADVHRAWNGKTPMQIARKKNCQEITRLLFGYWDSKDKGPSNLSRARPPQLSSPVAEVSGDDDL